MRDLLYDYKWLVRAYTDAHRLHYIHDDFKNFYSLRLKALETAFGIQFSTRRGPLQMLFDATVYAYWHITTPLSGFLEEGLIISTIQKQGETGQHIFQLLDQTGELLHRLHLDDDKIPQLDPPAAHEFFRPHIHQYFNRPLNVSIAQPGAPPDFAHHFPFGQGHESIS